jgi:hypothetical protein
LLSTVGVISRNPRSRCRSPVFQTMTKTRATSVHPEHGKWVVEFDRWMWDDDPIHTWCRTGSVYAVKTMSRAVVFDDEEDARICFLRWV